VSLPLDHPAREDRPQRRSGRGIAFLVRSLGVGGAERQLVALAVGMRDRGAEVEVVSFYPGGELAQALQSAGIAHHVVGKAGRWDVLRFTGRLLRHLRQREQGILYGFLPLPNIMLALCRPFLRKATIVWGVRSAAMDLAAYDWLSRLSYRLESLLSAVPDLIIANSHAGARHARERGFPSGRIAVVPNGIDMQAFAYDAQGRERVRAELGLSPRDVAVGMVARIDPMKGHETLIRAAPRVLEKVPDARFVLVGSGDVSLRRRLDALAQSLHVDHRIQWVPERPDMAAVYSAFDLFCLPSRGEGFSNAIAEAMACGRACIVTDVGDSAVIVGDCGRVVPPGDADALAAALIELMSSDRQSVAGHCRQRIEQDFAVERVVTETLQALSRAADARSR
jgi:glycosyltransferase involved in cell wall biosynthesis